MKKSKKPPTLPGQGKIGNYFGPKRGSDCAEVTIFEKCSGERLSNQNSTLVAKQKSTIDANQSNTKDANILRETVSIVTNTYKENTENSKVLYNFFSVVQLVSLSDLFSSS